MFECIRGPVAKGLKISVGYCVSVSLYVCMTVCMCVCVCRSCITVRLFTEFLCDSVSLHVPQ